MIFRGKAGEPIKRTSWCVHAVYSLLTLPESAVTVASWCERQCLLQSETRYKGSKTKEAHVPCMTLNYLISVCACRKKGQEVVTGPELLHKEGVTIHSQFKTNSLWPALITGGGKGKVVSYSTVIALPLVGPRWAVPCTSTVTTPQKGVEARQQIKIIKWLLSNSKIL